MVLRREKILKRDKKVIKIILRFRKILERESYKTDICTRLPGLASENIP
jgi:hypothetical protein